MLSPAEAQRRRRDVRSSHHARPNPAKLLVPALLGAAVAVGLGVFGNEHDPTTESIFSRVSNKTISMKARFATRAAALALFQVGALWFFPNFGFPSFLAQGAVRANVVGAEPACNPPRLRV
jgi:Family of unknown function (DUF6529)